MIASSTIKYLNLHEGVILDPEHYHPERLDAINSLKANSNKKIIDYFTEIIELSDTLEYEEGQPVFDLTDSLNFFLADGVVQNEIKSIKKKALPDDIIISRLRSYLQEACIVPKRNNQPVPLFSTEYIILRLINNKVSSHWLLPFLLSKKVQTILKWSQTGSNHPRFSSKTLLDISVPRKLLTITDEVSQIVKIALKEYEKSNTLYPEAENELIERLGFDKELFRNEIYYGTTFSSITKENRCDAEYYHPNINRLRNLLKDKGALYIKEFSPEISRGVQPLFDINGEVYILASKSIRSQGVNPDSSARTSLSFFNDPINSKAIVKKDDVLLNSTGVGSLGRASFYNSIEPAMVDNHVSIIRPNPQVCKPVYLSLFLNSLVGMYQSDIFHTGSSGQIELYPKSIGNILVYIPKNKDGSIDIEWQNKLSRKVIQTNELKTNAKKKIEEAVLMIERLI